MILFFRSFLVLLIDFLFPSYCAGCGNHVSFEERNICRSCLNTIKPVENSCSICSGEIENGSCCICGGRKFYIDKNIAVSEYSGVLKEILHNYKFNGRKRLYGILADLAAAGAAYPEDVSFVTSVPVGRRKKNRRGYDHSRLIAAAVASRLGKPYYSVLKERKKFSVQKNLGYRARAINVLGRFGIKNKLPLKDRNVLLVDDVFTTGATINECARIMKSFGAARVYSLTIARVNIKIVDNY